MKKISRVIISSAIAFTPFVVFAQNKDLNYLIGLATGYLNKALLLLMGAAVVMFVYYVIKFFLRPSDERKEGAKYLMWSFIGFFVILSMWGIVNVLTNTFNLNSSRPASWSDFFNIFPRNGNGGSGGDSNVIQFDS